MAIPLVPPVIPQPIAENGDVRTIPNTTPTGSNQLSFNSGFPSITSNPLSAGGVPPQREDFNAAYKLLSQHTFFQQSGGVYHWVGADSDFPGLNYMTGWRVLGSDNTLYVSIAPNGPDVPASGGGFVGPKDPTISPDYWRKDYSPADYWLLKRLEDTLDIYVSTTGDDSTANGSLTKPFRTINAALQYVANSFFLGLYNVNVNLSPGTFDELVSLPQYNTTGGQISIIGAGKESTTINGGSTVNSGKTITLDFSSSYVINGVTIIAPTGNTLEGSERAAIYQRSGSLVVLASNLICPVGAKNARCIRVDAPGSCILGLPSNLDIIGLSNLDTTGLSFLHGQSGGRVFQYAPLTMNGYAVNASARMFSNSSFARAGAGETITGTVTGTRYVATLNGVFSTNGGGANYFPGTVAGTTSYGGQYV